MKCRNRDQNVRFNCYVLHKYGKCCQCACPINFNLYSSWSVATPAIAKENHSSWVCYADEESVSIIRVREAFLCWCIACNLSLHVSSYWWNLRAKTASFGGGDLSCSRQRAIWKGLHYSSVRPTMRAMDGVYLTFIRREARRLSVRVPLSIISFRLRKRTYANS